MPGAPQRAVAAADATRPGLRIARPGKLVLPAAAIPGPIDQQKLQSYRNDLPSQQWLLQRQGVSPSSQYSREIQQQLNAPDPQ